MGIIEPKKPPAFVPLNPLRYGDRSLHGIPVMSGAFPLFGHMPAMLLNPPAMIDRAAAQLGPLFWLDIGFGFDKHLVYASPKAFDLFGSESVESGHFREHFEVFFGHSILTVDGAHHRRLRSLMSRPFMPGGMQQAQITRLVAELVEARVRRWAERGSSFAVLEQTQELALEIILGILGIRADLAAWRRQFRIFMLSGIHLPFDPPGGPQWWARRARGWIHARLRELIAAARADTEGPGLLSHLVRARDEQGSALTEEELVDNLRLLVLAGHETSASALAWMLLYLAGDRGAWERLCGEARAAGRVPTSVQEVRACPFAEALFREAVRIHPPVYAELRRLREPLTIEGHALPSGTLVHIPLWHLAHHPEVYDRPEVFNPERWLNRERPPSSIETSQFGGGPHFCLGYHLALLEGVQLAIATARELSARGLRPALRSGRVPKPVYLPLTHPPARARIELRPSTRRCGST